MKTKTLLLLASLAVLTTGASAAQYQIQTQDEVVVLPVYKVHAPRYSTVEKQINASLDEVRQQAKTPVSIPTECSALKTLVNQGSSFAMMTQDGNMVRLAKL